MTGLDRPVVDFDHHSESYARDPFGASAQLRAQGRMLFSERHGGYWVPTRYDDVAAVAKDDLTYSSRHDIAEPGETGECPYAGIVHPGAPIASSFIEALLDAHIEDGTIDLVMDFANPVPTIAVLWWLGLPTEDWRIYAEAMHAAAHSTPGSARGGEDRRALRPYHRGCSWRPSRHGGRPTTTTC